MSSAGEKNVEKGKRVSIFVSHHKDGRIFKSDIIKPVQVGAFRNIVDLNILRDDSGDNISEKNDKFCELTAQYWAWKNAEADYYGFMHYRRHFVFSDIPEVPDDGGLLHFLEMDEAYIKKIGLNDESILEAIGDADIILPPPVDLSGWCAPSNEIQYSCLKNLHAKDFDMACRTVTDLYPDYADAVKEFRQGHEVYWYNMFIMKKEIFADYCGWLFSIMNEADTKVDYSHYDAQEKRTLAFMAERLLTIYIIKLMKDRPDVKIKHLKITFLHHTEKEPYASFIQKAEKKEETPVEFIDWLYGSLKRSRDELAQIGRLPATDAELLEKGVRFMKDLEGRNLLLYGAGNFGRRIMDTLDFMGIKTNVEIWDRGKAGGELCGITVQPPCFEGTDYSSRIVVITIADKGISEKVRAEFESAGACRVYSKDEFMSSALNCIWKRLCEDR